MDAPRRLILVHKRAPGDTVVMTALVRDIALAHPGKFQVAVDTHAPSMWENNPYIVPTRDIKRQPGFEVLNLTYGQGLRDQKHETVHFAAYFHRDFEVQTGVHVSLLLPYPDLHLSDVERTQPLVAGRYWVFLSGGKSDFTAKVWHQDSWQAAIEQLQRLGIPCVQIGGADKGHWHPEIPGVLNLVGRTNHRDWLRLIYHADGVICGVTAAMHIAAALQRPCVVLAGGREAWWWEAYVRENRGLGGAETAQKLSVPHRFLHTIGLLDCCKTHGCWKNKVLPLNGDPSVCKLPIIQPGQAVPKCLDMITPEHVVEAVMSYYEDNTLPPIKPLDAVVRYLPAAGEVAPPPPPELVPDASFERQVPGLASTHPPTNTTDNDIFDNPIIGGKFTFFVLLYGGREYHDLHMRCLNSIMATCPPQRMDLRVGSNELGSDTAQVIDNLVSRRVITKHYRHKENAFKYPVMREMFWDSACPITTNYLIWFDDDSIADRNQRWLLLLAQHIIGHSAAGIIGDDRILRLSPQQQQYYRARPWYKGRQFRLKNKKAAPNGDSTIFAAGGFWAMKVEAMRRADVPDPALMHNGGDYTIGEQLYQAGYEVSGWNRQKQFIHTSSVPRRGASQPHFGTQKWLETNEDTR